MSEDGGMSDKPGGSGDKEFSDADRAWWEGLAGRGTTAPDADARVQQARADAQELRAAVLQRDADAALQARVDRLTSDEAHQRRREQLLARLQTADTSPPAAARRRTPAPWGWALAASLAVLGVTFTLVRMQTEPEVPELGILRSDDTVFRIADAAPRRAAEALAAELRAAGLPSALYRQGASFHVRVTVTPATPPAALAVLQRLGAPTAEGPLHLALEPPR
jgi:hypothetical protein